MNPYFEQMILGASPAELVRLLCQRAIRAVREAREHLAGGRIAERSSAITHAYAVVAELIASLDHAQAPDLAARLHALYCYIQGRLLEANMQQADAPLVEVLGLVTTLSEAWVSPPDTPRPGEALMAPPRASVERIAFSG